MTFEIGEGVRVRLDTLLSTRLMAQANSGGGKSYLLRRLLEQTHGRVQQFVIDPEGEFATLRQKFDYVLAAKQGGDTLAEPRAAQLLAERLLSLRVSAVLDIQELTPTDRVEFVRVFLESLIDAPKRLWHPALVVIDEAHVFCPQGGDAASSLAVRDLCARGRKRGYCAVLATQRISKLHKDAVAECNNKLIGRASLDVDMKRCADELGFDRDRMRELRTLKPGEFFAYGPAMTDTVTRIKVGPVITQHPKVGSRRARLKHAPPPTQKIRKMLPQLSDLPAEAEQQALTTRQLRARVVELEGQVRAQAKVAPKETIARVEVPVLRPADMRRLGHAVRRAEGVARAMRMCADVIAKLDTSLAGVSAALAKDVSARVEVKGGAVRAVVSAAPGGSIKVAPALPVSAPAAPAAPTLASVDASALTKPEQRILDAIAWLEAIGVPDPEQPAVSFLAGYTYNSGAFNNPRGALKRKGLIEYRGDRRVILTEAGRKLCNFPSRSLSDEELHNAVLGRLPQPEQRVLKPLLAAWPGEMRFEDVARAAAYQFGSGAFNNPRGRLRSLGLIEYTSPGCVRARDILFPKRRQS